MGDLKKDRICLFDNLRFFLIVLVVIGHFIDGNFDYLPLKSVFLWIYSFHMPLFLMVSGLFHKDKNIKEKVLPLLFLGFIEKIFISVTDAVVDGGKTSFSLLSDSGLPWYMFALAAFILITYLLRNADKRFLLVFSVALALFVGFDKNIGDTLYLSRIVVFYPFYLLGTMISRETVLKMNKNKILKVFSLVLVILSMYVCIKYSESIYFFRPLFTGRNAYGKNIVDMGPVYRLIAYAISTVMSFVFLILAPNIKIPVVSKFGTRTLQVYFWHKPVITVLEALGVTAYFCTDFNRFLAACIICVVISAVFSLKIFSFPIDIVNKSVLKFKE
ncbi:MAG: acyltransferase family protein [Oscillospiraceae bacterium]|nr:acyltransferase family protein [Oscillospiraceae bacterium]